MRIRVLTIASCPAAPLGYRHPWRLQDEAPPFFDSRDTGRIGVPSLQEPRRPSVGLRRGNTGRALAPSAAIALSFSRAAPTNPVERWFRWRLATTLVRPRWGKL